MSTYPFKKIDYKANSQEMHFWDKCEGCNFNEYIMRFIEDYPNYLNYYNQHKDVDNIIFTEKSPTYIRVHHAAYSLSYYAHLYDISFYVLLRDPIRRVWSGYWMSAVRGHLDETTNIYNQSDIHHIQLMNNKIQNDIDTLSI